MLISRLQLANKMNETPAGQELRIWQDDWRARIISDLSRSIYAISSNSSSGRLRIRKWAAEGPPRCVFLLIFACLAAVSNQQLSRDRVSRRTNLFSAAAAAPLLSFSPRTTPPANQAAFLAGWAERVRRAVSSFADGCHFSETDSFSG